MGAISAKLVKELRTLTGAGMMDCKKALSETDGDFENAINWLRTKGLATAQKKSGRDAKEGLVCVKVKDNFGAIVEINSETDFVARNEKFQDFVLNVTDVALSEHMNIDQLVGSFFPGTKETIQDKLNELIATIGENLSIRRVESISVEKGSITSYIHNLVAPNLGRIGVLIGINSEKEDENVSNLSKKLAMHIAAAAPISVSSETLDNNIVMREKEIFKNQAMESGKPDNIVEKMVEGRINKFYQEVCLYNQIFVIDSETKISDLLKRFTKDNNNTVDVKKFVRFQLGEEVD